MSGDVRSSLTADFKLTQYLRSVPAAAFSIAADIVINGEQAIFII